VFRASDFAPMTPFLPLNPAIDVVGPTDPDFTAYTPQTRKQYAMSAPLVAGSYYWMLVLLAEDGTTKDVAGAPTIAASNWEGTLHGVTVCLPPWVSTEGGKLEPLVRQRVEGTATATASQRPTAWRGLGADIEQRLSTEAQKVMRALQAESR